jgi:hypothetical protein
MAENISSQLIDENIENTCDKGNDKTSDKASDKGSVFSGSDINPLSNTHGWSPEHEVILIEWADKAMCYRWLHAKSNAMYSYLNALYTIPVIIISTLTGTANFAQQRVPEQYQALFMMSVGGFNLLAGIVTTIQQFLKITQLNEAHRVSSIAWDKFYRNIKIELAKHPSERIDVKQMVKMSKEEFDRLMETSPNIPENIISQFKKNFNKHDGYDDIVKPEICDILISTNHYRNPWFHDENREKEENDFFKLQLAKQTKIKKVNEQNNKIIKDFINSFVNLHNREPLETEIIDNLKEKIDITIIKKNLENGRIFNIKNDEKI